MPDPSVSGGNDPVRQAALRQLRTNTSVSAPSQEQLPQGQQNPSSSGNVSGGPSSTGAGQLAQLLLQILTDAKSPQADLGPALAEAFRMFVSSAADNDQINTLRAFVREYSAIRQSLNQTQRSQIDSFLMTIQKIGQPDAGGQAPGQAPQQVPGQVPQQAPQQVPQQVPQGAAPQGNAAPLPPR